MALIFEELNRTVIPNWRDFTRTLKFQELADNRRGLHLDIDISRALNDWRATQNVGIAADLINSAFIAGKTNFAELDDALRMILQQSDSQALRSLANIINTVNKVPFDNVEEVLGNNVEINSLDDFSFPKDEQLFRLINRTRIRAHQQVNNPIPWVELARLYSIFGLVQKADKAMSIAVQLAPNNRFVLRSATRLWAHMSNYEKALFHLRKSPLTKRDPWLTSAHIATSSLMKRYSPLIKNGVTLIESKNFSNFDITELASSIGTFEFNDGSIKKSQSFFNLSIKSPNDNSLAQLEWIAKKDKRFDFDISNFRDIINPFEAFALDERKNGNFEAAFVHVLKWFLDLPYATRPVLLGSYLATSFLKDNKMAIMLCEAGLKANPNDYTIINNLIYAYAMDNRIHECAHHIEVFRKVKFEGLPEGWQIIFLATNGLIEFKLGDTSFGKKLYEQAIEAALRYKDNYLIVLAYVNYATQLINNDCFEMERIVNSLRAVPVENANKELLLLKQEVFDLYDRKKLLS